MATIAQEAVRSDSANPRQWPSAGVDRIPAWVYTDPEIFAREMALFHHGRTWNYVGLECEVPTPNSWKRATVGLKSVIVVRDREGEINVLENRCTHRGAPLCWEQSGVAKGGFGCPYHQWRFNLQGDLIGIPFQYGLNEAGGLPDSFDKSKHGLTRLRVARRGGAIWATFDAQTPEFTEYVGEEMLMALDRIDKGRKLKLLGTSRQVYRGNWKMWIENARDNYHATLLHTFLTAFKLVRADLPPARNTAYRGHTVGRTYTRPIVDAEQEAKAVQEISTFRRDYGLNDTETVETHTFDFPDGMNMGFQMFPSCMFQPHLNVPSYRQIVPKTVDTHEIHWTFFGYEDDDADMLRRRLKQANLVGPAGFVTAEDGEVIVKSYPVVDQTPEAAQIVEMGLRGPAGAPTMLTEHAIRNFYEHYRQVMGL